MVVTIRSTAAVRKSGDNFDSFGLLCSLPNKFLVLYVRDKGKSTMAASEVFELLREIDMLEHPIHCHCFVGGEEEYRQWSSS